MWGGKEAKWVSMKKRFAFVMKGVSVEGWRMRSAQPRERGGAKDHLSRLENASFTYCKKTAMFIFAEERASHDLARGTTRGNAPT